MSRAERRRLDRARAEIPDMLDCKGLCYQACGPVNMSPEEARQIEERTGKPLGKVALDTLRCPYLNAQNRCDVYDIRPLLCRLYGTTPRLACDFGCLPKKKLGDADAARMLREVGTDKGPGTL